nr:dienelactone hydrolase family protein [Agrobacterium sp. DE0009]
MFSKAFTALMAAANLIVMAHVSAMAAEEVHFSSEPVKLSALRERLAEQRGEAIPSQAGTPLVGYLSRPKGAGPFPAIVVLHGCGGLGPRLKNDVAGRLVSHGYVVLAVDSLPKSILKSSLGTQSIF